MSLFRTVVYLTALPFDGLIDVTIFQQRVSSRATASQAESPRYPKPDNFPSPQTTFSYFQTWFVVKHASLSKRNTILLLLTNFCMETKARLSPYQNGQRRWFQTCTTECQHCWYKNSAQEKSFPQTYCLLIFNSNKDMKGKRI